MRKKEAGHFVISCIFWLIPGVMAGLLSAFFFSLEQYKFTVRLAESVLEGETLPAALKDAGKGGIQNEQTEQEAKQYLKSYGYREAGRLTEQLPYTMSICIPMFEAAGIIWFMIRRKEEKERKIRISELTEYLKEAGRGEAKSLSRREDEFSFLEDEIYKTVIELACTKEEAVKDHEILSERIADIAHQLKTPLTSMSLMTELLEPAQKGEEEYLYRLKAQVERLKGMVSSLLTLAKLDSHTLEFRQETIELEELIEVSAEPLREMMQQKHVRLEIRHDSDGEVCIQADMQWSSEAVVNILKNCLEHTPEGGKISVSYERNPLYVQVMIEDGGSGFQQKDLPHVFERFYRGEKAAKDNAGIGLALAKSIIEAQNGQVRAENSPAGHARFIIRLYRNA